MTKGASYRALLQNGTEISFFFAQECLFQNGLFAAPVSELPRLEVPGVKGENTHLRVNEEGVEYRCKLVTDVPVSLTDAQAINLLFKQIRSDLDLVRKWSQHEVQSTLEKFERRRDLAKIGEVRHIQPLGANQSGHKWLVDLDNTQWLANMAATFEFYGFQTAEDGDISLQYQPRKLVAWELGLPVSDVLNPFLNLLVIDHPQITPSFLASIELFDANGHRTGLTYDEGGPTLHGVKLRRGPDLAFQHIPLTQSSHNIILQIIELTQPLRDYLKSKGDTNWRRLLLSCGSGFGYPKVYRCDPNIPGRLDRIARRMSACCGISIEKARALAQRTRLPTIRSSRAVLIYIETESVDMMAKALGHSEYNESLLSHYLPRPIAQFFRERWIRIFQTGIVLEALKESSYRFRAAAFPDAESMDLFLQAHALKCIDLENIELATEDSQIIISVDLEILTLLASLVMAVGEATAKIHHIAEYWATLATRLFAYIDSPSCIRHDIRKWLHIARTRADARLISKVLYAKTF